MDYTYEKKSRLKKFCLWGAVVIFLLLGMLGYYYCPHLLWKYCERKLGSGLTGLAKISNTPMPEVDIPEDWTEHSLGCMYFRLPPDLFSKVPVATASPTNGHKVDSEKADFYNDNIHITIILTSWDTQGFLKATSRMHPTQKKFSTMTQLRLEACGTVAEDFRWSMSRREASWHTYIVSLRQLLLGILITERTESFSGRNWEGLLFFKKRIDDEYSSKKEFLQFLYECDSCSFQGTIYFGSVKKGEKFDPDVARRIIQSIEINCGCLRPCPSIIHPAKNDGSGTESGEN